MATAAAGGAGRWFIRALQRAVQSPAAKQAAAAAAAAAAKRLPKFGNDRLGKRRAAREQRELAEALARQVNGKLSYDTVIDHAHRVVVWSDGKPLAAFRHRIETRRWRSAPSSRISTRTCSKTRRRRSLASAGAVPERRGSDRGPPLPRRTACAVIGVVRMMPGECPYETDRPTDCCARRA